jgi:TatD DNase family protein
MSSSSLSQTSIGNKFIDIGANLMDDRFMAGIYHGKPRHETDFDAVLERAVSVGLRRIILTAGTLSESREAIKFVREWRREQQQLPDGGCKLELHTTVGVHPTRCNEFLDNPESHIQALCDVIDDGTQDGIVVAVGEMGLDYDRLEFCHRETQHTYFQQQLSRLGSNKERKKLPLFLHNRNVGDDLYNLLVQYRDVWTPSGGVVHSFDDTWELAQKFLDIGLYLGINGCSLKTDENLNVVRNIPLDRILLETDCPYCDVRRTHAGYSFIQTNVMEAAKPEKKFQMGFPVKVRLIVKSCMKFPCVTSFFGQLNNYFIHVQIFLWKRLGSK